MADITFNCQFCEQKIEAPAEMAGMKAECPSCQCELQIPNRKEIPAKLTPVVEPRPQFVAAKCPSCKGDLQVPNNREEVKCMYCGGTVIVNQAIQLVSGVNVANLIELAKAAAKAINYKEAYDYYTKVLEFEPMNS